MVEPVYAPFVILQQKNLPAHWLIPPDWEARTLAGLPFGLNAEQVDLIPCLIVPECTLSASYMHWLHGLPKPNSSVSVFVWDVETFNLAFGPKAKDRFILSMRLLGRPHHLHATVVSTVDGHRQFHRLTQLTSPHWYRG